jgi:phosphoglycolate phosphatase-like HAD superfamily hydrolase
MTTDRLYKVLMFGARDWSDPRPIRRELRKLIKTHGTTNLVIIEGECPSGGADLLARIEAERANVHVVRVPALWQTRYRGAGPQRNRIMAMLDPDEGIGFHPDIKKSKGTKDMANRLKRAGIPYRILER